MRRYLEALEKASHFTWGALAEDALGLPEKLILVHPKWHPLDVSRALNLLPFVVTDGTEQCQAERIWGYECPLTDRTIQADHVFPRSLGGPRDGLNQVWLCADHNGWKGNDLFGFPWENGEPAWLEAQVQRVRRMLPSVARWCG